MNSRGMKLEDTERWKSYEGNAKKQKIGSTAFVKRKPPGGT